MSQIIIDIGAAPDDGLGTPLRTAFSEHSHCQQHNYNNCNKRKSSVVTFGCW